jgi:hypothetical protein
MVQRTPLIQQLTEAWKKTIKDAYNNGLINSEAGLQTHFCLALLDVFQEKKKSRRLFIEPHLPGIKTDAAGCYPDVVICNTQRIIGVVELKYLPRARPGKGKDKDLQTLTAIAEASGEIELANDRYWGTSNARKYPLADDAVLCWAGVYTGERLKLALDLDENCKHPFLQLDAITREDDEPIIYPESNER